MADTQVKMNGAPSSSVEDCKKHLMKVFRDVTKDCDDRELRILFHSFVDYDTLNEQAIHFFNSMVDCGSLDEARELFKPLPDQVTLPEVAVFTLVIVIYASARKTMDAHKVYHKMIASGVLPAAYTYSTLICTMAVDSSNPDFVGYSKKYFLEMLDRGMKPRYVCYKCVMAAIAYRESEEEANKFLEHIKGKGFIPDHNDFEYSDVQDREAVQISYLCDDLHHSHHSNILDRDVKKFVQKKHASLRKLTEYAVKMFHALVKDGNVVEAMAFTGEIQATRTEPAVLFHTLVIEAYLKFGKIKGALEAYLAMLAAGVAPNSYTYAVLIKGLATDRNYFGDAKKYLLEMMNRGNQPNVATYTAVIEGFARKEDKAAEDEGKEFVELMMGKGFVPNAKAMREVLKGRPIPVIRRIMNIVLSKLKG